VQAAVEAMPEHVTAWYNLGVTQRNNGKSSDAELSYRTALRLDPHHKDAANALATKLWAKVTKHLKTLNPQP
jgi:cytochrome c-type biogenesis protein CcmH/NrfG